MLDPVLVFAAIVCGLAGGLLALAPGALPGIEAALNRTWGGRTVFALRLGVAAERSAEHVLNRPVSGRGIYWDRWIRRHPRASGIALLCLGAALLAIAAAG